MIEGVEQYGGKAAILNYIAAQMPEMPIPRYVVKQADQELGKFLSEFKSMNKPVIVRSSSPHEYSNFEGIFDSIKNVHDQRDLEKAVRKVEASAVSERARLYAQQHGLTINDKIHLIIQEQSPSRLSGAMMRHPNNPDLIFINCFKGEGRYQRSYFGYVYNEKTCQKEDSMAMNSRLEDHQAKLLVDKYKEIESLKELSNEGVLYVEFGLDPFMFYQARPFKKIETADFELPEIYNESVLDTNLTFGITPPDGIVYPVLRSVGHNEFDIAVDSAYNQLFDKPTSRAIEYGKNELRYLCMSLQNLHDFRSEDIITRNSFAKIIKDHNTQFDTEIGSPYCFLTSSAKREDYDVDLTIPNMGSLVIGQAQTFLTHGLMRLIKKANVTFAYASGFVNSDLYGRTKTNEDKIRIISNGKEAIAMRE